MYGTTHLLNVLLGPSALMGHLCSLVESRFKNIFLSFVHNKFCLPSAWLGLGRAKTLV